VLIKENHLHTVGSLAEAVEQARIAAGDRLVEVEVETLEQAEQALTTAADRLLLDEFSLDMLRTIVAHRDRRRPAIALEASGNITRDNVRAIAETGVDYISIGAITKNVKAIDLSLRIV
jgi:nicotinate-nucleotide pyrophosphorylase (carboxylating)